MTIDYKALAERIKFFADELGRSRAVSRRASAADLRTVVSLLEGMAEQEPVNAVPFDVAYRAVNHVGMANYAKRQQEAVGWLQEAEFEAFTHPAPQQPKPDLAPDPYPDEPEWEAPVEPTEAQVEARDALLDFISENGTTSEGVQHYLDRYVRAALAAREPK